MRKWGFGYSSQQSCASKLAVCCASMGWMLSESALCHSSWWARSDVPTQVLERCSFVSPKPR